MGTVAVNVVPGVMMMKMVAYGVHLMVQMMATPIVHHGVYLRAHHQRWRYVQPAATNDGTGWSTGRCTNTTTTTAGHVQQFRIVGNHCIGTIGRDNRRRRRCVEHLGRTGAGWVFHDR